MHPVLIAVQAAMFDHLAEGPFHPRREPRRADFDAEALGILDEDRNKLFAEAIDVILAIWEGEPPYNIELPDNRYKVSTARTMTLDLGVGYMGKPYQKPRPEIVGTVVAPYLARRGADGKARLPSAVGEFPALRHLKSHWENYCKGQGRGRRTGQGPRIGASRARSSCTTTTRSRRAMPATTRRARIGSITRRCAPR